MCFMRRKEQTDGQTDMSKLTDAYRNFTRAPNKVAGSTNEI